MGVEVEELLAANATGFGSGYAERNTRQTKARNPAAEYCNLRTLEAWAPPTAALLSIYA
jgi:hypothetical protein